MDLLLVFLLGKQLCLPEICRHDKSKNVDLPELVEITD